MAKRLPTDDYKGSQEAQSRDHLVALSEVEPEKTLDFYVASRNGKKRNFVFNWSKAKKCSHSHLIALAVGGQAYRCGDCNYSFDIVIANVQPLHLRIVGDFLNILHYTKEFGAAALQETLRQPHGQLDGSAHKSALPEGMNFEETIALLEEIDVTVEDGGKEQLQGLLDTHWISARERERRERELSGRAAPHLLQPGAEDDPMAQLKVPALEEDQRALLEEGNSGDRGNRDEAPVASE